MKSNRKSISMLIFTILMVLICILITACSGVEIQPDGNGGVTIHPNGNTGNGENSDLTDTPNESIIHTHTYTSVDSTESTNICTSDSIIVYRCTCGAEISETLAAPGHQIRSYEGKAATCDVDGYEPYEKCVRGGCTYTTYKVIPALGHSYVDLPDIDPTCTADGLTDRRECVREGCNHKAETVVPSLGHIVSTVSGTSPTCTQPGLTSYEICTRPGCQTSVLTQPTEVAPLDHNKIYFTAKEPTCTEFGWNAYSVCQRCNESDYSVIPAKGHNIVNGYCACGYQDLTQHTHTWDSGVVVEPSTCMVVGMKIKTCTHSICEATMSEVIPALGHDWEYYSAKEATCTEPGYYAYEKCSRCGYDTKVIIPVRDHNYTTSVITTYPTCTQSGIRTYYCACGLGYNVDIDKLGHDWGQFYVVTDPTCTTSGLQQRICRNESSHVDYETVPKLGHDWGEYYVTKEATCTSEGMERRDCHNDPSHSEISVISKAEHNKSPITGECTVCGLFIGERLNTPEIIDVEGTTIMWGKVDGAVKYEVTIDNVVLTTTATQIDLEKYFGNINRIQINIRAKAAEGSGVFDSMLYTYIYNIPGNPISSVKGIGDAVNLLTGKYTEFASGTTRIWNEALFARLRADDRVTNYGYQVAEVTYCESLDSYLNSLTESINNKTNINTSVGYGSFVKATSNFSYSVGTNYKSTTENSTKAVFYDMDYKYVGKSVEIYGYNDKNKLSSLISDEFKVDAAAVQAGTMTPADFIKKYGTHIVTAGIYGAKFNIHYEMLTTTDKAETTFGENIEAKIGANIQGSLYGVDLGLGIENTTTANKEAFKGTNSTDMYTSFTATAIGGGAVNMMATDLGQFAAICDKWTEGLQDSNNHILIDVPDGSLFFVWDFLGEEYSEAKTILYNYFYAVCDDQYYSLKNKISDMYSDSYTFDENTGTLTVNLSGLQTRDEANLGELNYKDDTDGTIVFDSATGVFTVYSKYNNYDVQRVVFIGKYGVIDHKGELIETTFDNFCIKFASGWNRDIVLELVNFGFEAPNGHCGIDFSQVKSENIKIIATGDVYIRGGDANEFNSDGCVAINKGDGVNLIIQGEENLVVENGLRTSASIVLGRGDLARHTIRKWTSWGHDDDWWGSDTISPNFNTAALIEQGYTTISVTMTFRYKVDDWGDQMIQVFSHEDKELHKWTYEWDERDWSTKSINFTLSLGSNVARDGSFWIKWYLSKDGTNSDTWHVGLTIFEITVS